MCESLCVRTFIEVSDDIPLRALGDEAACALVFDAVVTAGRVFAGHAGGHGFSW